VFTAAVFAILAVGACTSAFSPILLPQAMKTTTMQHRSISMHASPASRPLSTASKLTPLQLSSLEIAEEESPRDESQIAMEQERETKFKSMNPTPVLVSMFRDVWNRNHNHNHNRDRDRNGVDSKETLKNNSLKWAAAMAAMAIAFSPLQDANAAMSGGRMGGSFSSMPRSSSISSPSHSSRSYSSPSYSSRSYLSPSVSVSPRYYNRPSYAPTYYSRPSLAISPTYYDPRPDFVTPILVTGTVFLLANLLNPIGDQWTERQSSNSALGPGTSVVQLSVALDVPDRDDGNSILNVLDRLSRTAETDSRVGIQVLTSQVALELLRRRSSIVSASSSTKHFSKNEKALREFENRSVKERSKFETETVSKFGGVDFAVFDHSSSKSLAGSVTQNEQDKATMAVVTMVLAIDGDSTKLNTINSASDVEQALNKIASDAKVSDCLLSAEILWTPEDRTETLRSEDVVADYPELRSI